MEQRKQESSPLLRWGMGALDKIAGGLALAAALVVSCVVEWPSHAALTTSTDKPDLYVLAVGVNTYRDGDLPRLKYAEEDVRSMEHWARGQAGRLYEHISVLPLVGSQVTREKILEEIPVFTREMRPGDHLIVLLAGHGVIEQISRAWYFLTWDTSAEAIVGRALSQDELLRRVADSTPPDARVLFLIDSCHAGRVSEWLMQRGSGVTQTFVASSAPIADSNYVARRGALWAVFSAGMASDTAGERAIGGGPEEIPWIPSDREDAEGHGIFTHAVLSALGTREADKDLNGIVTLREFSSAVDLTVRSISGGRQIPVLTGQTTDVELGWAVGALEVCDGVDNDLDSFIDEEFDDLNGDHVADCLALEACNGRDDNQNDLIDEGYDRDHDGFVAIDLCGLPVGTDCDDTRVAVHPQQIDVCNGVDDDCDGFYDEDGVDLNGDQIPDCVEATCAEHRRRAWIGISSGVAAGAAGAFSTLTWADYVKNQAGDQGNNITAEDERAFYGYAAGGGVGLGLSATGLIGGGVEAYRAVQCRKNFFPSLPGAGRYVPPPPPLVPSPSQGQVEARPVVSTVAAPSGALEVTPDAVGDPTPPALGPSLPLEVPPPLE